VVAFAILVGGQVAVAGDNYDEQCASIRMSG
jgi:hypothetical protein